MSAKKGGFRSPVGVRKPSNPSMGLPGMSGILPGAPMPGGKPFKKGGMVKKKKK